MVPTSSNISANCRHQTSTAATRTAIFRFENDFPVDILLALFLFSTRDLHLWRVYDAVATVRQHSRDLSTTPPNAHSPRPKPLLDSSGRMRATTDVAPPFSVLLLFWGQLLSTQQYTLSGTLRNHNCFLLSLFCCFAVDLLRLNQFYFFIIFYRQGNDLVFFLSSLQSRTLEGPQTRE